MKFALEAMTHLCPLRKALQDKSTFQLPFNKRANKFWSFHLEVKFPYIEVLLEVDAIEK